MLLILPANCAYSHQAISHVASGKQKQNAKLPLIKTNAQCVFSAKIITLSILKCSRLQFQTTFLTTKKQHERNVN